MSDLKLQTSENTNTVVLLQAVIGFAVNLILALVIIHLFLTPQIYLQSPLNLKAFLFGTVGALIPLILIFIGIKTRKVIFPVNKNTEGLIKLINQPWGPAAIALGAGISEELLFRGAAFELVSLYIGAAGSALIISILFMLIHLPQYKESPLLNFVMFILSIVFTYVYVQSGTIWAPIIAHAIYNYIVCLWIRSGFLPLNKSDDIVRKSELNV